MNFFSEERAAELRELFFESAKELLQALNEEGLQLEKRPTDEEVVRRIRRTVHTLKGDSAACGYTALSEIAHELEDVLTPDVASHSHGTLAEVVLSAADVFQEMLAAYKSNSQVSDGHGLREQIRSLVAKPLPKNVAPYRLTGRFAWSEYEQMAIQDALARGECVFSIAVAIDPQCSLRAAAMQLIRTALSEAGKVLAMFPEQTTQNLDVIEAAVASTHDANWISKKCRIPAMVADVLVEKTLPAKQKANGNEECDLHVVAAAGGPQQVSGETPEPRPVSQPPAAENMLRVDAERIDAVLNLVGELIIGKSMMMQALNELNKRFTKDPLKARFGDAMAFQARVMNDLQKAVMKVRMVSVEQLFRRFPRLVRDTAKACGRQVELAISGQETDLDKSILDVLAEPLAHLVRNAVDHGIESAAERLAANKPPSGTVKLNAYHQGNQIVLEVSDDGGGIDKAKVIAKAIECGIITVEEAARLTDGEVLDLIFHPGLSTAEQVTAVSGRGVGMDVVKTVVDRLKGIVQIESQVGVGTKFLIKVPLTLAIIKALMFQVADKLYAVPLASVLEITRAEEAEIHHVDHQEVIQLRGQVLALIRLHPLTRIKPVSRKKIFVVVIALGDRKFGLIVDKLVGEEELVIKALNDHLVDTDLVSGASILGDGTVALILNISSVVRRLGKIQALGASA